jgi:hypothetical protein
MNADDLRVAQSFRGIEAWSDSHAALIPPEAAGQVEVLRGVNQRLAQYAVDQEHQNRAGIGGTVTVTRLRHDLWQHHLVPVATMARSVITITPELAAALRVPRPDADVEKLLASANAIATIGDANKEVLVQHGLPTTFVDDLRAEIGALKVAIDDRRKAKSLRVGATKAIAAELKTGRLVVQRLDVAFTRVLREQPGLLAEWRNTKRVTVKPVVHQAAAPDVATTPPEHKAA